MPSLCSLSDVYILDKIRSGEWVPSLDTGQVYSHVKRGFLAASLTNKGYVGSGRFQLSHVIWIAANGPVPYGMQIDHINGDKTDNRLCNLRLVSASENTHLCNAKLTYKQAEEIRRRYASENISQNQLATEYRVNPSVISKLICNKTYTTRVSTEHVTEEMRKEIMAAFRSGGVIDTMRRRFKIQQAVLRQVIEEELSREAAERKLSDGEKV